MHSSFRAVVLLAAIAASSCGDPLGPGEFDALGEPSGFFRTSATGYRFETSEMGVHGTIVFSYTNATAESVYPLEYCAGLVPPILEKQVDGEWVRAWVPIIPRCGASGRRLLPGEMYRDTLHVFGGWPGASGVAPEFTVDPIEGRYRLLSLSIYSSFDSDSNDGELLPRDLRTSSEFVIELVDD